MQLQPLQPSQANKVRVHYKALDDGHAYLYEKRYNQVHFLRRPILETGNQKMQNAYLQDYKENFDTKSEMRRSNLSRMNQQLEQQTNLYTHLGKYDSKWAPESYNRMIATSNSSREDPLSRSRASSGHAVKPMNYREEQYYRPLSPVAHNNIQYPHSYEMQRPVMNNNVFYNNQPTQTSKDEGKQRVYVNVENAPDAGTAMYYQAHNAKQAVKEQAHEAKEEVKDNAKQATKAVVGEENYQLMSMIKNAAGQIKDNVMDSVKVIKDAVVSEVKETANVVADQAIDAKDAVHDQVQDAADTVKDQARQVKYAAQDATDAVLFQPYDAYNIRNQRQAHRNIKENAQNYDRYQERAQREMEKVEDRNDRDQREAIKYSKYYNEDNPLPLTQRYSDHMPDSPYETAKNFPSHHDSTFANTRTLNTPIQDIHQQYIPQPVYAFSSTPQYQHELYGKESQYQNLPRHQPIKVQATPSIPIKQPYEEVSPIRYSKKTFSMPPAVPLSYCWVFTLLAMGLLLVIFQLLK